MKEADKSLGMDRPIDRRDFISGVAAAGAVGAAALAGGAQAQTRTARVPVIPPGDYPPTATGLRGQYEGSFEAAHAARDGEFEGPVTAEDTGERYDLVIVGGGISGLSAAHFFREALGHDRKVLILDNHDDFGGHAKRNEFHHNGRMYLSYGGTMSIETPFPYSWLAKQMVKDLGIDVASYPKYVNEDTYKGLGRGYFFGKEHFQRDKLVVAPAGAPVDWPTLFKAAPLTPAVRADLIRLHTEKRDYMPSLNPEQKAEALKRMTYQDFLMKHAGMLPGSLPFFLGRGFRNNMRVDTCPAYTAAKSGAPGFQGMEIAGPRGYHEPYDFHWPDGNATIARMLVNRLVPTAFEGGPYSHSEIVTQKVNYQGLDVAANPTRLRLSSMVIRAEHVGDAKKPDSVRVVYVKGGKKYEVRGDNVILACFNMIIPFIVPALPDAQKANLRYASKVPMVYTNVLVRNWESFKKLGINSVHSPSAFHPNMSLDIPVSIGDYKAPNDPSQPIIVHMVGNPNSPGLPRKEQNRMGRAQLLATPFEDIERNIRSDMARALKDGGFDPARDILAITANRWPHGYAYTYDTVGDPDVPDNQRPHVLGRATFGRMAIANADSGGAAFTNTAIDEAHRAVQEVLINRGLT
ncbi:NAD(P)-binding protein [Phenylobacterium sp.]|jgi:spermidine dehydrogenase|uniref:NAD(P)-binding protein n=1 Tax=Phenylobacterium sp. TaxID=1871053 RepID=UPI0037841170